MKTALPPRTREILAAALLGIGLAGVAFAGPGLSNRTTAPNIDRRNVPIRHVNAAVDTCNLVTFEGVPDFGPVGTIIGDVAVTFGTSWLGLVDADAGGSGNFANEPSPSTIAFFLDQTDISIGLAPTVRFVSFWYTAAAQSLPVTVTAYDSFNNPIAQALGNTVGTDYDGAPCIGDPDGSFCTWDRIVLVSPSSLISRVEITGTASDYFGIDDLLFCVDASPTPARVRSWGGLKTIYR